MLTIATLSPAYAADSALPAWLVPDGGTVARVDAAPWNDTDEPEAALTASSASLARDFSSDGSRPGDVVYEPIGVRVHIVRVLARGIAQVQDPNGAWNAFAPLDRLVPEVPRGTHLRAAGGFGGFAELYRSLQSAPDASEQLPTGSRLTALEMGVARYDPSLADLIRVRVHVDAGALRGRTGWVAVTYTGIDAKTVQRDGSTAEAACNCRIVRFALTPR